MFQTGTCWRLWMPRGSGQAALHQQHQCFQGVSRSRLWHWAQSAEHRFGCEYFLPAPDMYLLSRSAHLREINFQPCSTTCITLSCSLTAQPGCSPTGGGNGPLSPHCFQFFLPQGWVCWQTTALVLCQLTLWHTRVTSASFYLFYLYGSVCLSVFTGNCLHNSLGIIAGADFIH